MFTEVSAATWDEFLLKFPAAHVLQTSAWGELKAAFGWEPVRICSLEAGLGAQILFRKLPIGFSLAYLPKGPLGADLWDTARWGPFWREVDDLCRRRRAIFLKVETDVWETSAWLEKLETHHSDRPPAGFHPAVQDIQPSRTLLLELQGEESDLLGRMKQKTRYNIRLAQKKGVTVQASQDLETFYRLMQITGERDVFGVHSLAYYRRAYEIFQAREQCVILLATYQAEPAAAIMVFAHGPRAWYFYGASAEVHREKMPNHLLQWEGMRWARQRGCLYYDLWGVPDEAEDALEAKFERQSGGLWGVYRFKRGFGGSLLRQHGPWDRVYQPLLYRAYTFWARRRGGEG